MQGEMPATNVQFWTQPYSTEYMLE